MKKIIIAALASFTLAASATAQNIDLIAGTLEGEPICEMTLDDLTGTLGRPSSVESPPSFVADIIGPNIGYHHLGLMLNFVPGVAEPGLEQIRNIDIYVARSWDSDNSEWFQAFPGSLTPAVDGNWRLDRTLADLGELNPTEDTPEDQREFLKELGVLEPGEERAFEYIVRVKRPDHLANFFHEPVSRFLERVGIACTAAFEVER